MIGKLRRVRKLSLGSAFIILLATVNMLLINSSVTWGYFSNTLNELITISTGIWDVNPSQAGTSIKASKSAEGFWDLIEMEIMAGVSGEICVTNGGERPTENLGILDVVQIKIGSTAYTDYISTPVDLTPQPMLNPGEIYCYPYEVNFLPVDGAKFRNVARITITNHSGWLLGGRHCPGPDPCPFGPEPKTGFRFPEYSGSDGGDISAKGIFQPPQLPGESGEPGKITSEDPLSTPTSPTEHIPTATRTLQITSSPIQAEIPRSTPTLAPTQNPNLTLTVVPTETPRPTPTLAPTMNHQITLTVDPFIDMASTPTLAPTSYQGPTGCTYSLGYWLDHPNGWPLDEFNLGDLTLDQASALEVLAYGAQGDVTFVLGQQYITAQLNIASPADPSDISEVLESAQLWFSEHPLGSSPKNPGRKAGIQLADALEEYNVGSVGPGICEQLVSTATPTSTSTLLPTQTPSGRVTPTLAPTQLPTMMPTLFFTPTPQPPTPELTEEPAP